MSSLFARNWDMADGELRIYRESLRCLGVGRSKKDLEVVDSLIGLASSEFGSEELKNHKKIQENLEPDQIAFVQFLIYKKTGVVNELSIRR